MRVNDADAHYDSFSQPGLGCRCGRQPLSNR